ncbi:MAG TPA: hypothetical protein VJL29_07055 [Thermoguttaceae bacterium]|nr:hypothetical protein [Thermoguttaceae bacterium]
MACHPILTHAAARRITLLAFATVLAGLLFSTKPDHATAQQAVTPVPIEGSEKLPFTDMYQAAFGSRDLAFRLNYDTERYGQENGQFGLGVQGHRPFDGGLWLFSAQYNLDFGRTERMGLDLGGGVRMLHPSLFGWGATRILGAQLWYDGLETEIDNYFNQMGFSLESLGDRWDFRVNGNFPIGTQTQAGAPVPTGVVGYFGDYLAEITNIPIDEALSVVDFEAATRVSNLDAWLFAGGYGLDASGDECFGAKGGVRGWIGNDAMMELAITNDEFFDTRVNFAVVWYPGRSGLFSPRSRCLEDRLRDPVIRNDYIATRRLHEAGGNPLTDLDGNAVRVVHVNSEADAPGDGSYENPYTSLDSVYGGSQAGDIILVWSGSTYTDETVTLRDRQRLLGEGTYAFDGQSVTKRHTVTTTQFGDVDLAPTRAGALAEPIPVITNTTGDVVTLAAAAGTVNTEADDYNPNQKISYNEVSNLSIVGGTRGIVSPSVGIGEVNINNMTIADTTGHGVELTPFLLRKVNNVGTELSRSLSYINTIEKTQFNNIGGNDIDLDATSTEPLTTPMIENITVQDVRSADANGWGIRVLGNSTAATIDEYQFAAGAASLGGIQFESSRGGATISNSEIEGTTVAGSTGVGVELLADVEDTFNNTFTFNDVRITDMGTAGLLINGGDTDVDFTGLISETRDAPAVHVMPVIAGALTSYHTGTLNFNEMTGGQGVVRATDGTGLVFEDANGVYNFNNLVDLDGVTTGIDISNTEPTAGGLFTFSQASISNPDDSGGAALRINGGQSTVNFTGLISHDEASGYSVDITDHQGSVTFNEAEPDEGSISATFGDGLLFTNADGAYRFNSLISISNAATAGISIVANGTGSGSDGTFTFSNVAIDNIAGVGFNLNAGTAQVNFTGAIAHDDDATAAVTIGGGHHEGTGANEGSGTVTFNEKNTGDGVVTATDGLGLQFNAADGTYNFNHLIDLHRVETDPGPPPVYQSPDAGISITNGSDGTFTFSDVVIDDINGVGFNLNGGTAAVNFTGKITQTAYDTVAAVTIGGGHKVGTAADEGSGIVTFTEKDTGAGIITASKGDGLQFTNADGTYLFSNKIDLSGDVGSDTTAGIAILKDLSDNGSDGTFTFNNVAVTNIDGVGFQLDGGTAAVNFTGLISQNQDHAAVSVLGGHREGTAAGEGTGVVTFNEKTAGAGIVIATEGDGLQFVDADGTYRFNHKIDLHRVETDPGPPPVYQSPDAGISITGGSDGTFTFSNVAIDDIAGVGFNLNGGTAAVNFTGKITQTAQNFAAVTIGGDHHAGVGSEQGNGTVTFTEKTGGAGIITASTGPGLVFTNADGTYNFNNAVTLSTNAGINIQTSDGTLTFSNATVTDSKAVGLNINGGKANVNFTGLITQNLASSPDVTPAAVLNVQGEHTGTLNMTEKTANQGIIVASTGPGLAFSQADGTYNLNSKMTLSGTAVIDIEDSDGTFNMTNSSSTISNASGTAFSVDGGEATIAYAGKINSTGIADPASTGKPVSISNVTGGTINFSGDITSNSLGSGIVMQDNAGGTVNFTGHVTLDTGEVTGVSIDNSGVTNPTSTVRFNNLDITTTTGTGFSAIGGGILLGTGGSASSITTTGTSGESAAGTAMYIDGMEIGSGGFAFQDVSATNGTTAITLNNLTGSGTLTINDGTITGTADSAVSITNTANVSLNNMNITNSGAGDGIHLVHNNATSFNVTIANSSVSSTTATGDSIHLAASGSAAMHLTLNGNTVTQSGAGQQAIEYDVNAGAGNTYITMTGNSVSQTAAAAANQQAVLLDVGAGTCYFQATGSNSFSSNDTTAASYAAAQQGASFDAMATGGALNATIHDNTFDSDVASGTSTTARGFRMAAVGGPVKLSLLDNVASADSGAAPFLCYKNGGSSFGVELLKTPDATAITDKTPEVNIRNGGSGAYSDYVNPPNATPAAAGWVIEFLPDAAPLTPLTPPITLGFGNLAEGAVPTQ